MPNPVRQNGAAIRRLRQRRGLKVSEMARRVEIHSHSLVNVENDAKPASPELLYRLARELAVPVDQILSDHGRAELGRAS